MSDYERPNYACLEWHNKRWHRGSKPIHAGCSMKLRMDDGSWLPVRIESRNTGEVLLAYFTPPGGLGDRCAHVNIYEDDLLRWPEECDE